MIMQFGGYFLLARFGCPPYTVYIYNKKTNTYVKQKTNTHKKKQQQTLDHIKR